MSNQENSNEKASAPCSAQATQGKPETRTISRKVAAARKRDAESIKRVYGRTTTDEQLAKAKRERKASQEAAQ